MDPIALGEWLEETVVRLAGDERVAGVVGAATEPGPWSDPELWVVVEPGADDGLRSDPSWLPGYGRLVLWIRERRGRMGGMYDDGTMISVGLSDLSGLDAFDAPAARVILDKGGVADRLREVRRSEPSGDTAPGAGRLAAGFVAALQRGLRRHGGGERLAGRRLVCDEAVDLLLAAVRRLDGGGWDPWRDAEGVVPDLARRIAEAVTAPTPDAALALLAAAESAVKPRVEEWPDGAAAVVRRTANGLR